jgi:hypothetical protein
MENNPKIPDTFSSVISDFANDLCTTFPEHAAILEKWRTNISSEDLLEIYTYCITVYPKRFFDILYQNDDIFKNESEDDTFFFPGLNFKHLYQCSDITDNTKKSIWKYLQLVLFTIIQDVKDKANFGDSMNMFEGIDEGQLHEKLKETMSGISDFFSKMKATAREETGDQEGSIPPPFPMPNFEDFARNSDLPDMENIQDHLRNLFNGKIGSLAKEMAEEITEEFKDMLGEDVGQLNNTEDAMKLFMKDPKKLISLMKKISTKLDKKMADGDISREEIMKEASEMMSKMKEMGGGENMKEMFEKFAKGMGKNMRMDVNAMNRMTTAENTRNRLRTKLQQKKDKQNAELEKKKQLAAMRNMSNYSLETVSPDNLIFRLEGEEGQERTMLKTLSDNADKMAELLIAEEEKEKIKESNKSKPSKKKNKKTK